MRNSTISRDAEAQANLEAARIIAGDSSYQGVIREWAELVLRNAAEVKDEDVGPLFRQRVA